jgi:hypothetical protein
MFVPTKKTITIAGVISAALLTTACSQTAVKPHQPSGAAEFTSCQQQAFELDASASTNASAAQFLQSASVANTCLQEVDDYGYEISRQQLMQLHALSVQNYLKGGDVKQAQQQLESFRTSFENRDLYYSDNTSFIDSFSLLLHDISAQQVITQSSLNARGELKAELRRIDYWQKH